MSGKTLADLFAEEPSDGTHLVKWEDSTEPIVIWRDDAEAKRWDGEPDERWFNGDPNFDPMTFRNVMADATQVHAVVPLDMGGLALVAQED